MVDQRLCLAAPAKINLYLKITGRRPDGYHELNTLMQKLALYDELELALVPESGIHLFCPGADLPEDERNIVHRAARLFLEQTGRVDQGIRIVLKKNIPVAAGLGGGSSDAATVLTGLDSLLATGCGRDELAEMGLGLGADVPLFIHDMAAAWATGIGEKLEVAVPLAGYRVLLVNPGIGVSTKWAYETFALTAAGKKISLSCSQKEQSEFDRPASFCKRLIQPDELVNDLEAVTADKYSVINIIKQRLLAAGAVVAMMTGSGPTVFGIFSSDFYKQARQCSQELHKEYYQVYLVAPLV
jgi:4-diphosphocytidyl-2-C-methyl-D-erythritol kinase